MSFSPPPAFLALPPFFVVLIRWFFGEFGAVAISRPPSFCLTRAFLPPHTLWRPRIPLCVIRLVAHDLGGVQTFPHQAHGTWVIFFLLVHAHDRL